MFAAGEAEELVSRRREGADHSSGFALQPPPIPWSLNEVRRTSQRGIGGERQADRGKQ